MLQKAAREPTQEQIDSLVEKYSATANVLDFFYTSPSNTFIDLTEALKYGLKVNNYSGAFHNSLPEFKNRALFPNTVKSNRIKTGIISRVLQNLIDKNPQYFRKVTKMKYAISEAFIVDFLFHNKDKDYDKTDIKAVFHYILDFDNFTKVLETFYLPYNADKTTFSARHKFRIIVPYKYSKKANAASVQQKAIQ